MKIHELEVCASQESIVNRIKEISPNDIFGEYVPALIKFLDYNHAKEYLNDGVTEATWHKGDNQMLREDMYHYMNDWWKQKVEDGRGLSVHRGRAKVINLLFVACIEAYAHIGMDAEDGPLAINGGWYQEDAYNLVADIFDMPHIRGRRD